MDEAGGEAVRAAVALRLPREDGGQRLRHQHIPLRKSCGWQVTRAFPDMHKCTCYDGEVQSIS